MTDHLYVIEAPGTDPVYNLALESVLAESVREGEVILYLWQNDNTVVIGRNQNIRKECRMSAIQEDGVRIVRRSSGGGAVYHDLGNLNYTFICCDDLYDEKRQNGCIRDALMSFGIEAEASGRNDLLVNGRKISGNAYRHCNGVSYQHGTLLVHSDLSKMPRYLSPDTKKLKARGVDSVRSRVGNLTDVCPQLGVEDLKKAVRQAAERTYGLPAEPMRRIDLTEVERQAEIYGSKAWIFGPDTPFDTVWEERFDWGGIRMEFCVKENRICQIAVWSDAMDPGAADAVRAALEGCTFTEEALLKRMDSVKDSVIRGDICGLIKKQEVCNVL